MAGVALSRQINVLGLGAWDRCDLDDGLDHALPVPNPVPQCAAGQPNVNVNIGTTQLDAPARPPRPARHL